jgi:hypothetical protein
MGLAQWFSRKGVAPATAAAHLYAAAVGQARLPLQRRAGPIDGRLS